MVGITTINGFHLPMDERFARIRRAGFCSVMLWWGDEGGEGRAERVACARECGLAIENVHADTNGLNEIWVGGEEGEQTIKSLTQAIVDCGAHGISTMVLHLTNGSGPPPVSAIGTERIGRLIEAAQRHRVRLALENMRMPDHLRHILDGFESVGLCYDSGHAHCWTPETDWLGLYGDRLFALHLHDNLGDADSHLIPFDGSINWDRKAAQIASSCYQAPITLESEYHSSDVYQPDGFEAFLDRAHQSGIRLQDMIARHRG